MSLWLLLKILQNIDDVFVTSVKILQNIVDVFVTSVKILQNIVDVFVTSVKILQNIVDVFVTSVKILQSIGTVMSCKTWKPFGSCLWLWKLEIDARNGTFSDGYLFYFIRVFALNQTAISLNAKLELLVLRAVYWM